MNTFDENGYDSQNDIPAAQGRENLPPEAHSEPRQTYEAGQQAPNYPPQQPLQSQRYYRESPYADSPYMNARQQPNQYRSAPEDFEAQPRKHQEKKQPGVWGRRVVAGVLCLSLVAAGCGVTAWSLNSRMNMLSADNQQLRQQLDAMQQQVSANTGASVSGTPVTVEGALTPGQVYAQNVRSVVSIHSFMGPNQFGQVSEGSGSGFILTGDGYIVTNHHVIEGADKITVTTSDNVEYPAALVGSEALNDVAVLKVEAEGLPAVTVGSSDDLIIGDMVVAIGNPLGTLAATQTVGYVCGKDRDVSTDGSTTINMLQTDAAINPGNSGGPLFNMKGEVIGITTAKYSGTTGSGASIEGIGFAIPINDVMDMVADLMQYGYVTGAYLGVTVMNMDPEEAAMYNIPMGAYIRDVVDGGSADRAGIRSKDIVTRLGDYEIRSVTDLTRALRKFKAGDTITITVYRSGDELELPITLDEKPNTPPETEQRPSQNDPGVPDKGDFDEWYNYFAPFFGFGN